jgi:hypothetical protein
LKKISNINYESKQSVDLEAGERGLALEFSVKCNIYICKITKIQVNGYSKNQQ